MEALWRLYGGSMEALWRLYGGSMEAQPTPNQPSTSKFHQMTLKMTLKCPHSQSQPLPEALWRLSGGSLEALWRLSRPSRDPNQPQPTSTNPQPTLNLEATSK